MEWHRDYDDPGSLLSRRGELVQGHLRAEIDHVPAGNLRLISLCAGQGRDVIGVLAAHPRRHDVHARLVELDKRNVAVARQTAGAARLEGVEMLQADAGVTDACAGAIPAQIVVVCGIFGNITVSDIQITVAALPSLCAPSALVLWTRHRSPPDLTPAIRSWFKEAGFREEAFDISDDGFMSVGAPAGGRARRSGCSPSLPGPEPGRPEHVDKTLACVDNSCAAAELLRYLERNPRWTAS
ncbi:MAG: SAM-dependent methyltransferase [Acidimicrobiales bacterium]